MSPTGVDTTLDAYRLSTTLCLHQKLPPAKDFLGSQCHEGGLSGRLNGKVKKWQFLFS